MKRNNGHAKTGGAGRTLIFGVLFNALLFLLLNFIVSLILGGLKNPTGNMGMASTLTLYLCALISGFSVAKFKGNGGALPSSMSSLIFLRLLMVAGLILTRGRLPSRVAINYAVYMIIATLGALFAARKTKRQRRR